MTWVIEVDYICDSQNFLRNFSKHYKTCLVRYYLYVFLHILVYFASNFRSKIKLRNFRGIHLRLLFSELFRRFTKIGPATCLSWLIIGVALNCKLWTNVCNKGRINCITRLSLDIYVQNTYLCRIVSTALNCSIS